MRTLLQIQRAARLRSASCSLQGLSSTQRSARATPSRDLTLGAGEQKGTRGNYHSHLKANRDNAPGATKTPACLPQISMLRCLGAFIPTTTFIRDMRTLLQIRQFAQLRSTSCSLQGLSSTQRSARATPSRDRTLGAGEQKGTRGNYHSHLKANP